MRAQLNGSLYTHTAYRGHCSLQHASNIQSIFSRHTHADTLTHIFSQPLSHKCQYREQVWHISLSPSLSPSVSVLLPPFSKRELFIWIARGYCESFFKTLSFVIFLMVCKLMHGVKAGGGGGWGRERGRRPSDHQSRQSSPQWQVEGLWHFWLTWLMCFEVRGEPVSNFLSGAEQIDHTSHGSAQLGSLIYF